MAGESPTFCTLKDSSGNTSRTVAIFARDYGIAIHPEGYSSKDGGEPILIINNSGEIRVLVWGDINNHAFTSLSLAGANDDRKIEGEKTPGATD